MIPAPVGHADTHTHRDRLDVVAREQPRGCSDVEAILAFLPVSVIRLAGDGTIVDVNGRDVAELFGGADDPRGRPIRHALVDDVGELVADELGRLPVVANGIDLEFSTGSGPAERHYEARLTACPGGEAVAVVCDVTDRRRAELEHDELLVQEQLARAQAELAQQRITSILERITSAFFALDKEWRFTFLNGEAEHLLQRSRAELLGKRVWEAFPGGTGSIYFAEFRRAIADQTTVEFEAFYPPASTWVEIHAYPAQDGLSVYLRDISVRRGLEEELRRQAFHDALTGLPNRALFLDRLQHALARADGHGRRIAILFLDLDNFKVVNDSLGHETGDRLLVQIAERLRTCLRAEDTAARFGGDEFTVLLEETGNERDAIKIAKRLTEALRAPIVLGGHEVYPSFSIGIAPSAPGQDSAEGLLRKADLAMYRAKTGGKGRYVVFDQSMNDAAMERLGLEADLRRAIERGEFRLVYQPIVSLEGERICEVEALIRWLRPGRGLVSPSLFVPLAEETGLIVAIGQWVLEQACLQAVAWHRTHPDDAPRLSVNLSAKQFQHPRLVEDIARSVRTSGLDPRMLTLEITESAIMVDTEAAAATLLRLKDLGIQLAIDDFGTGYSSLSYLKRFRVDTLKIDRSFVDKLGEDPHDTAIVRGVVALAKSLNLAVTAEGIETADQLEELRALGCDKGQGYYFARPLPPESLEALLGISEPRQVA
jgi:diguanylate cyclase (GGDEF)-like protein